jgi:cysteine dioxygenase
MSIARTKSTPVIPSELHDLIDYLESLDRRADTQLLEKLLAETKADLSCLSPFMIFGESSYRRNLIKQGKWFELLCICWRSGQRSPIHDHAQSTCGLKIMTGVATETLFETTDCGQIKAISSTDYGSGFVCSTQDDNIHQISNLQSSGTDLVTLHIYSPAIKCMDTYSLLDSTRSIYVPQNANYVCELGDCI